MSRMKGACLLLAMVVVAAAVLVEVEGLPGRVRRQGDMDGGGSTDGSTSGGYSGQNSGSSPPGDSPPGSGPPGNSQFGNRQRSGGPSGARFGGGVGPSGSSE